jgi:hypothetical protein
MAKQETEPRLTLRRANVTVDTRQRGTLQKELMRMSGL